MAHRENFRTERAAQFAALEQRTPSDSGRARREKKAVLFIDTFNRYFEPENACAATEVLEAAGYQVDIAAPVDHGRPLCCGRTFLAAGLVAEAKAEARRMLQSLRPYVEQGVASLASSHRVY